MAANFILEKFPVLLQYSNRIFWGGLAVQFMVLLWMGTHLETVGNNDFGSVYHSAETWVLEQRFPEIGYFAIYPNNMGAFFATKRCIPGDALDGMEAFFSRRTCSKSYFYFLCYYRSIFFSKKTFGR